MQITGYQIARHIGQGGMAMVYPAVQAALQRPVALKVMHLLFTAHPECSARFLNEGRLLAALRHTNIMTISDIGVSDGWHYISMAYVDGGDLRQRIQRGMLPETACDYTRTLGRCLNAAHAAHIVHRDVKPVHMLFRRDGTLLLTDCGMAKILGHLKRLTATGRMVGSPYYLSPEQRDLLRVATHTARSDNRLTLPDTHSAYYYFQQVLALAPGHSQATAGCARIAARSLVLVRQAFEKGETKQTKHYVPLGLHVQHDHVGLRSFHDRQTRREQRSGAGLARPADPSRAGQRRCDTAPGCFVNGGRVVQTPQGGRRCRPERRACPSSGPSCLGMTVGWCHGDTSGPSNEFSVQKWRSNGRRQGPGKQ